MRLAKTQSIGGAALALVLCIGLVASLAHAETASVIDPTEGLEPPKSAAQPDAAVKRARAEAEQRRRARAEARAQLAMKQAAEKESARLRAIEQARQAEAAAREAEARAAAKKAAAAHAANSRAAAARVAAARLAAEKELAAREAAAREAAARELAQREAAAREAAAKEAAEKEATARAAAAKVAADRLNAAREATARENRVMLVASRATSARDGPMLKEPVGTAFRDCARCPELVWLPPGESVMGEASFASGPRPVVAIRYMLAVGRFEVTFAEWDACVAAGGCRRRPHDAGWGRGWQPVINVSWVDAKQYVAWLSRSTGRRYRLLTEAEWEYAARAGTDVRYWWGDQAGRGDANCADCGSKWDGRQAAPVGRFAPNPFGLHDMHGNVSEWVEDCFHDRMRDAPLDGRAWTGGCLSESDTRVVRGGAWYGSARSMRSSSRTSAAADHSDNGIGFRVARTN
jgi:formylglycine-generating enzyme required for sulfatase activity